ncbi:hypothetical protein ACX9NJ_27965 [Mycobacterium sp. ML2]|uniref:hypothetical protein n=1 Tax=Mycobacterium sp. MS3 TaxID=3391378 RepID=UPI00398A3B5C
MTQAWRPPAAPAPMPGSLPPGPCAPPPARTHSGRRRRGVLRRTAVGAAFVACVFGAGVGGVAVGAHLWSRPTTGTTMPRPAAPAPAPEVVRTQTINLCTRFAAAYASIPTPQTRAADMIPAANYIADALRDTPVGDPGIRAAITTSLQLMRDHGAALSREPAKGAVQPPVGWTAAAANAADDQVWALCNGYQE